MDLRDVWVLEYSPIQGCFHVNRIIDSAISNSMQITGDRPLSGYVVIYAGSKEDCHAHGEMIRNSGVKLLGRE